MSNPLTHDMVRKGGTWRCVDCDRSGTIAEINAVACERRGPSKGLLGALAGDGSNVLDAVAGTGRFGKSS